MRNRLSDAGYADGVDVLSDVIATMRVGRPVANRASVGSGGWRFAPYTGSGFHIVLEGRCWLVPDRGEPVELNAGDVVLLPHGDAHALAFGRADPPSPAETVLFEQWRGRRPTRVPENGTDVLCGKYRSDGAPAHPLVREMPTVVHVPSRLGQHTELRAAIDLLAGETGSGRPGGDALLMSLLDAIFVYLVRAWLGQDVPAGGSARTGWRQALADPVCVEVLDAMHSDPARPWTMQSLSRHVGVSRATLARRFTALVGRPPMAYLTWWRMTTAARLLRSTDAPLAEIAERVGYTSAFAFAHAFKRELGAAPGRYRQENPVPSESPSPDGDSIGNRIGLSR